MTAAELAARITAARAVRADFERASQAYLRAGQQDDWLARALRLADHLSLVLDALDTVAAATRPAVLARNYDLTPAELATVVDALSTAAVQLRQVAARCPGCDASSASLCPDCDGRLARAAGFDALAATLRRLA